MGIGALMMARMGSMYYGNAYGAMDGKLALSRINFNGKLDTNAIKNIANKDKQYDIALAQERLKYLMSDPLYAQEQALKKRWAQSFDVFG